HRVEAMTGSQGEINPRTLVDEHRDVLSAGEREAVLKSLGEQPRPVRVMNPVEGPPKATVRADGISITGPAAEVDRRVKVDRRAGEWGIEIHVAGEPRRTYE